MKLTALLASFLLAQTLFAESGNNGAQGSQGNAPQQQNQRKGFGVQVLSDDFFDPPKKEVGPKTSTSSISGSERYYADDPDYNTGQRREWLSNCAAYKNQDSKTYRDCFENEKSKSVNAVRQKFEEVERRQTQPMKNISPDRDDEATSRNPSYDVDIEEEKN